MANRLSAVFGMVCGVIAGFITRDDYIISSQEKIYSLGKEFQDNNSHLETKIHQEQQRIKDLDQQIGTLQVQIEMDKQKQIAS